MATNLSTYSETKQIMTNQVIEICLIVNVPNELMIFTTFPVRLVKIPFEQDP